MGRTELREILADLRPTEGRLGMTWRIALVCALVAAVAMIYKIPEPAIGCYLIIYLMKRDASTNIAMGIGAILLVTVFIALVLFLTQMTIEVPFLRLSVMALASFAFVYLGAVSKLGDLGSDMALVVTFALSLVSAAPVGEVATRGLLYAWQMVAMPMALMVCFNMVAGTPPSRLLRETVRDRIRAVSDVLRTGDAASHGRLRDLLAEGNADQDQRALLTRVLHYVPNRTSNWLAHAIEQSYRLMLAAAALPATAIPETRLALAGDCDTIAAAIDAKAPVPAPARAADTQQMDDPAAIEIRRSLGELAARDQTWPRIAQEPFFAADALSNPGYQRFALKTTLAAMICYIIYAGIDWQGIHTAMITCFVAALGTTGETVHKLALRITGCLIGAAMGIAAILFVIPNITSVGGLMVLVFVAMLPAAWVTSGSERISYGGVQIGLAFLLTVLQGFEPGISMDDARDRIIGILLGNFMVYVIFTQLWPVGVIDGVRGHLSKALSALAKVATTPPDQRRAAIDAASTAMMNLRQAEDQLALAHFEPQKLRPDAATIARLSTALTEAAHLASDLIITPAGTAADEAERLNRLARDVADQKASGTAPTERVPLSIPAKNASQRIARIEHALGN
jgi:multidrug resistance protein MdtO